MFWTGFGIKGIQPSHGAVVQYDLYTIHLSPHDDACNQPRKGTVSTYCLLGSGSIRANRARRPVYEKGSAAERPCRIGSADYASNPYTL